MVAMHVIIVESPTKAKTFSRFVNEHEYVITSSMGHVADLPQKKLGITLEDEHVHLTYTLLPGKKKMVNDIVTLAKKARSVILATDPDREGEAISYHLKRLISEKDDGIEFQRIVFHEITKEALEEALKVAHDVNQPLVDAQQARRAVDRLVGYKISPYLWKRFSKRWLSAGRVQTVALRFIVERERERTSFSRKKYYGVTGTFIVEGISIDGMLQDLSSAPFYRTTKLNLFDGTYSFRESVITSPEKAQQEESRLKKESYIVSSVTESLSKRTPPAPFTTSSLQQYASTRFGYSPKRTMRTAQMLYEKGVITYHRTDSVIVSSAFIQSAHKYIEKNYGHDYIGKRVYKTATKNAQEAHEAIRPTKLEKPDELSGEELKIYDAIYKRALASQMADATIRKQRVYLASKQNDVFITEREQVEFNGYLAIENDGVDSRELLPLTQGQAAVCNALTFEEKETQPPPAYSEASLIKTLEKRGIGRPSTYAPIVTLIQERQYVKKVNRALEPTQLGIKMVEVLSPAFPDVFNVEFTAQMEKSLDEIAEGSSWEKVVIALNKLLEEQLATAQTITEKVKIEESTDELCPRCQKQLVIKMSRFGKFYACSGFPDCKYTKSYSQQTDVECPECHQGKLVVRFSKKKRRFYGCSRYPDCNYTTLWLKEKTQEK